MPRRQLQIACLLLAVLGLVLFAYKASVLDLPLVPDTVTPVWTVEARIQFRARGGPVKAAFRILDAPPGFTVLDEHFVSYGYGFETQTQDGDSDGGGRLAAWSKRRASGRQSLYYRAVIYASGAMRDESPSLPYPQKPEFEEPVRSAALSLLDEVRGQSADIATFAAQLIRHLNDPSPGESVEVLLAGRTRREDRVETAIRLLAGARIPARIAWVLPLEERRRDAELVPWLAVHNDERWLFFNPETGSRGLPSDHLLWWRGPGRLLETDGARGAEVDFSLVRAAYGSLEVAEMRAERQPSPAFRFSLLNLPIRTQAVYQILVMIPIGALLVVVMRNLVGLPSFGTFMPILIGLAFRETGIVWGLVLFSTTVGIGLVLRRYLARLKLLLVPRLASVLIVVILVLASLSVLSQTLGIERGLSVALFPIVILTMVIERMSLMWEESGAQDALNAALGSLGIAIVSHLAFVNPFLQHVTFVFPELLLLLLAATLLLGRYSGYRLLELRRFRALSGDGV